MSPIRSEITKLLLRYLDTDSLLCWASAPPDPNEDAPGYLSTLNDEGYSLREPQETALRTMRYFTRRVWPGLTLGSILEGTSVIPRKPAPGTRGVVRGWIWNLDAWELAALERATFASKSLAAARLIVEWSEGKAGGVHARAR
jgi:ATP synthase F1 complex assembly factor 2